MSDTLKLACHRCCVYLWVGQTGGASAAYLYQGEPYTQKLERFLFEHLGHPLEMMWDFDLWEAYPAYAEVYEDTEHRQREMRWLREHQAEYAGQWVVVQGDKLIAHGLNAREVAEAAYAAGIEVPFLVHVENGDELPWGGW
jgi:uncharacterized protein DUF5678